MFTQKRTGTKNILILVQNTSAIRLFDLRNQPKQSGLACTVTTGYSQTETCRKAKAD
jgi:hypothetical protein